MAQLFANTGFPRVGLELGCKKCDLAIGIYSMLGAVANK